MGSERALELLDALPVSGGPVEEVTSPPERPKRKKKKPEYAIASAQKQSGEEAPSGAATSHPSQIGSIPDPANPECQEGVGESASIGKVVVYFSLCFLCGRAGTFSHIPERKGTEKGALRNEEGIKTQASKKGRAVRHSYSSSRKGWKYRGVGSVNL